MMSSLAPYAVIIASAAIGILFYLLLFSDLSTQFIQNAEIQRRAGIVQLVRLSRNAIEPVSPK